jgi:hypothetical protein
MNRIHQHIRIAAAGSHRWRMPIHPLNSHGHGGIV